jgi:hypothetical protein
MRPDNPEHGSLEERAADLADGQAVDWETAELEAVDERERRWLQNLRVVDQVARTARKDFGHDEATRDLKPVLVRAPEGLEPGDTPTLRSWGHLNILERIGAGGFGEVFRAWDTLLNRPVALKLLHAHGIDEETLLHEARLLARVEHPNVARVYGVERHEGRVGIWMELIEGVDLRSLLREGGPFEARTAAAAGRDIAAALAALHAGGVLHRDIKPQNIIQASGGRFVLMDLGAGRARRMDDDDYGSVVTGTPRYIAPELLLKQQAASPRSEVYALGVTLFNLLSGEFPVDGSLPELYQAHQEGRSRRLSSVRPELPTPLVELVDRAIAPDPSARFASAEDMRVALDATLRTLQPKARPWRRASLLALAAAMLTVGVLWISRETAVDIPLSAEVQMGSLAAEGWAPLPINAAIGSRDQVQLTLQLSRSAHVYILNRDAEGHTVVLFPMQGGGMKNPLPAGRPLVLPGVVEGERKGWAFSPIAGAEDFLVIASDAPLSEFEGQLLNFAAVDVGGGLTVQPLAGSRAEVALLDDFVARGVIGLVDAASSRDSSDVFALAEAFAEEGARPVWMQRLRLLNTGQ